MKINRLLIKTKLMASGIHLGISLVVFFILAYQIYYVWYPQPYFSFDGGWQGIQIIAAVDLVLGPFITFVVFDWSKSRKEILFDLMIIATIQISALVYGVVTTYQQRPVAIVLTNDYFIPAIESDYGQQLSSISDLDQYSLESPPIIWADTPVDQALLDEIKRIKREQNIVEYAQIQLYQPSEKLLSGLQQTLINTMITLQISNGQARYEEWLQKNGKQPDEVLLGVFNGRYGRIWLVFDNSAKYIGYFK